MLFRSLLVLDEPTNHLDMHSKDILKNALLNYNGSLIVVSHDREFLNGLTNRLFEFRDRKIKEYRGNIFEFLEKKKMQSLQELERNQKSSNRSSSETASSNTVNKKNYEKNRQLDREIRKAQKKVDNSEERISRLEEEIHAMDKQMEEPDKKLDNDNQEGFFSKYNELKKELQDEMWNWEKLAQKVELLKTKRF